MPPASAAATSTKTPAQISGAPQGPTNGSSQIHSAATAQPKLATTIMNVSASSNAAAATHGARLRARERAVIWLRTVNASLTMPPIRVCGLAENHSAADETEAEGNQQGCQRPFLDVAGKCVGATLAFGDRAIIEPPCFIGHFLDLARDVVQCARFHMFHEAREILAQCVDVVADGVEVRTIGPG